MNDPNITVEIAPGQTIPIEDYKESVTVRIAEGSFSTLGALYDEIYGYIYQHIDLLEDLHYHVLTAWALHTWKIEQLNETGYLLFKGNKDSGKSRSMKTLRFITFNGEDASIITKPAIYRLLNVAFYTFFIDEFDQYSREKREALIGILNSGYVKGGHAVLCDQHDKNRVKRYPTFGAKAVSMIGEITGSFRSRCITIPMIRNIRIVNFRVDKHQASIIYEKCKEWKSQIWEDPIESTEHLFRDNGITNMRLIQTLNSLTSVVPPNKRHHIIKFAKQEQEQIDEDEETQYISTFTTP